MSDEQICQRVIKSNKINRDKSPIVNGFGLSRVTLDNPAEELENKIRELTKKLSVSEFKLSISINRNNKVQEFIELDQLYKLYLNDKYPDELNEFGSWFESTYDKKYYKLEDCYAKMIVVKKIKPVDDFVGIGRRLYSIVEAEYLCNPITFDIRAIDNYFGDDVEYDIISEMPKQENMNSHDVSNIVFEYDIKDEYKNKDGANNYTTHYLLYQSKVTFDDPKPFTYKFRS